MPCRAAGGEGVDTGQVDWFAMQRQQGGLVCRRAVNIGGGVVPFGEAPRSGKN
jgi:hypothetical protein